jgi:hypothetical protein
MIAVAIRGKDSWLNVPLRSWAIRQVRLCSFEKIQVLYTVLARAVVMLRLRRNELAMAFPKCHLGRQPLGAYSRVGSSNPYILARDRARSVCRAAGRARW